LDRTTKARRHRFYRADRFHLRIYFGIVNLSKFQVPQ